MTYISVFISYYKQESTNLNANKTRKKTSDNEHILGVVFFQSIHIDNKPGKLAVLFEVHVGGRQVLVVDLTVDLKHLRIAKVNRVVGVARILPRTALIRSRLHLDIVRCVRLVVGLLGAARAAADYAQKTCENDEHVEDF